MEEPWEQAFRVNMRHLRKQRGWSQGELGELIRARGPAFGQQVVARVEKGERPLRLGEAFVIADVLGSDIAAMGSDPDVLKSQDIINRHREASARLAAAILDTDAAARAAVQFIKDSGRPAPKKLAAVAEGDAWEFHKLFAERDSDSATTEASEE